jgi:hypothetical protein
MEYGSQRWATVDFTGWEACQDITSNPDIRILISDEAPHANQARIGSGLRGQDPGIVLNFTFANWGRGCITPDADPDYDDRRRLCIENSALHEFGHAAGLSHPPAPCNDAPFAANTDELVGDDPVSVMSHCDPALYAADYNFHLSDGDARALQVLSAVTVARGRLGNGLQQKLVPGTWRASLGDLTTVGDNQIAAVRVPRGLTARLCADDNGGGTCREITGNGSLTLVGPPLTGTVSYVRVIPSVTGFSDRYFGGRRQTFKPGTYRASSGQLNTIGDDQLSSLILPPGLAVEVCRGSDGRMTQVGGCQTIHGSAYGGVASLDGWRLGGSASYLRVDER